MNGKPTEKGGRGGPLYAERPRIVGHKRKASGKGGRGGPLHAEAPRIAEHKREASGRRAIEGFPFLPDPPSEKASWTGMVPPNRIIPVPPILARSPGKDVRVR